MAEPPVTTYTGRRVQEILGRERACIGTVVLPDGSKVLLQDCKVVIEYLEESAHLINLLAEGEIKLDLEREYDRKRAVLSRLENPYFSLPGFPKVCRHGPLDTNKICEACEKDKADASRRLGR